MRAITNIPAEDKEVEKLIIELEVTRPEVEALREGLDWFERLIGDRPPSFFSDQAKAARRALNDLAFIIEEPTSWRRP